MPKRRRIFTPVKKRANPNKYESEKDPREVSTPRGRLKGALQDVLEPYGNESDTSIESSPDKSESTEQAERKDSSEDEHYSRTTHRQSYVLKLFDRSVDLSQFEDDTPLYPICRAWITNQPRANYRTLGRKHSSPKPTEDSIELPGPEGPPISRIPELLPIQKLRNKDNINLNYREAPPPSREHLLQSHISRWVAVREAWLDQSAKVEARYETSQQILNQMNVNAI